MDKTKGKKRKIQHEPKLSFGSALKQNVRKFQYKMNFIMNSLIILPQQI
jgi:hypothetical protein